MILAVLGFCLWTPALTAAADTNLPAKPLSSQPSATAIRKLVDSATAVALSTADNQGNIWDPVGQNSVGFYGPAGFGYAGLRAATRSGDRVLLERSIRSIMVSVNARHGEPFDLWLTARSYDWAQHNLADDPLWTPVAAAVAAYLGQSQTMGAAGRALSPLFTSNTRYNNWKLVELAASASSTKAGLPPVGGGGMDRVGRVMTLAVEAAAPPASSSWAERPIRALSDPSSNPPAYSVFSAALLADATRSNPALLSKKLRRTHEELMDYVLSLAAPDGTVAWASRSMQLSWTLAAAMTVGLERGGRDGLGLANAAWRQFQARFGLRADGYIAVAPILRFTNDSSGIDAYANTVIYGGLTAIFLNDAADALARRGETAGQTASGSRSGTFSDPEGAGLLAQRRGDVWWGASIRNSTGDLRYQPGLQAVKIRSAEGWTDVLPARPKVFGAGSLWPAPARCQWRYLHREQFACGKSRLQIVADHRRQRVQLRLRVDPRAIVRGVLYVQAPVRRGTHEMRWRTGSLRSSSPPSIKVGSRNFSSATHDQLQRVDYRLRADRDGRLEISIGK